MFKTLWEVPLEQAQKAGFYLNSRGRIIEHIFKCRCCKSNIVTGLKLHISVCASVERPIIKTGHKGPRQYCVET